MPSRDSNAVSQYAAYTLPNELWTIYILFPRAYTLSKTVVPEITQPTIEIVIAPRLRNEPEESCSDGQDTYVRHDLAKRISCIDKD